MMHGQTQIKFILL